MVVDGRRRGGRRSIRRQPAAEALRSRTRKQHPHVRLAERADELRTHVLQQRNDRSTWSGSASCNVASVDLSGPPGTRTLNLLIKRPIPFVSCHAENIRHVPFAQVGPSPLDRLMSHSVGNVHDCRAHGEHTMFVARGRRCVGWYGGQVSMGILNLVAKTTLGSLSSASRLARCRCGRAG